MKYPTTKEFGYLCIGLALGTILGSLLKIYLLP
jgi:hypothetical protein